MKKFGYLLAVLMVMMVLVCGSALAEEIAGNWYLESVGMNGMNVDPAMINMSMNFSLNADGTGSVVADMDGDVREGSVVWTQEGDVVNLIVDGDPMPFTMTEEGKMTAEVEGLTMVLAKEGAAAPTTGGEALVITNADEEVTLEAFNGTWVCTEAKFGTNTIKMSDMGGMAMTFVLENGAGTMELVQEDGDVNTSEVEGELKEVVLNEGEEPVLALVLTAVDKNMTSDEMNMILNEEGKLEFVETSTGLVFVLENQDAE